MSGHNPTYSHRQRPSRRRLLGTSAGLLATGLAGCVGGTDDDAEPGSTETSSPTQTRTTTATSARHEQIDSFTEVQRTGNQSTSTLSFEVPLGVGQFAHRELRVAQPSEIRITGESTAKMDVFLLAGERAFSKYQAGESAIFSDGFTATGIDSIERVVEVPAGTYFLVFDNTPVYGAAPEGEVNAKFEILVTSDTATSDTATSADTGTETETETEPPSQPKIREVRDNFGHTFTFDGDTGGSVRVDDEVVVSDETVVELCVTDVAKRDDDSITFSYDFLDDARHPDNPGSAADRIADNCWSWEMRREDYQSDWGFRIWVRNDDEIYYQNNSVETDYSVTVYYTNLTLAE